MSLFGNLNTQTPQGTGSTNTFGTPPTISVAGTGGNISAPGTAAGATPAVGATGGLFGQPSQTVTPGTTGGLFGNASAQKPQPFTPLFGGSSTNTTPGANPLFGGKTASSIFGSGTGATPPTASKPSLFGTPKPTDQNTATPQSTTSNLFAKTPSTGASTGTPAPSSQGLFGSVKPAEGGASTTPAMPSAGGGLFSGGGMFGSTPASGATTTPQPATTATATQPPPNATTSFSLGAFPSTTAAKDKPTDKPVAGPAPAFGLFGNPPGDKKDTAAGTSATAKEAEKPKTPANAPPPGSTIFGSITQPTSGLGTTLVGTSTLGSSSVPAVPPPSMLRGKSIDDIINRWTIDLDTHVQAFERYAVEIAAWDRALLQNANNLATLYSHVLAAEREQNEIDSSLDHIEQQQKELSNMLDAYEKSTEEVVSREGGGVRALESSPADAERDKYYMLASELHTHLDVLSTSLSQLIEGVNALSLPITADGSTPTPGDDPMDQIAQILSSHLDSLQWIDGAVREVEGKVGEVEKRIKDSGVANAGMNNAGMKPRGFGNR